MKLIDEKLVYEFKYKHDFNGSLHDAFDDGVDFAEQQLKQKMVEFAEYINNKYKYFNPKSGKQLLEEFITQQK